MVCWLWGAHGKLHSLCHPALLTSSSGPSSLSPSGPRAAPTVSAWLGWAKARAAGTDALEPEWLQEIRGRGTVTGRRQTWQGVRHRGRDEGWEGKWHEGAGRAGTCGDKKQRTGGKRGRYRRGGGTQAKKARDWGGQTGGQILVGDRLLESPLPVLSVWGGGVNLR